MAKTLLILKGLDLPAKVNTRELQAAVAEATGGQADVGVSFAGRGANDGISHIAVNYDPEDGIDLDALKAVIKAHVPERNDFEELALRKHQETAKRDKLAEILEQWDDVMRRLEALERNGSGRK